MYLTYFNINIDIDASSFSDTTPLPLPLSVSLYLILSLSVSMIFSVCLPLYFILSLSLSILFSLYLSLSYSLCLSNMISLSLPLSFLPTLLNFSPPPSYWLPSLEYLLFTMDHINLKMKNFINFVILIIIQFPWHLKRILSLSLSILMLLYLLLLSNIYHKSETSYQFELFVWCKHK